MIESIVHSCVDSVVLLSLGYAACVFKTAVQSRPPAQSVASDTKQSHSEHVGQKVRSGNVNDLKISHPEFKDAKTSKKCAAFPLGFVKAVLAPCQVRILQKQCSENEDSHELVGFLKLLLPHLQQQQDQNWKEIDEEVQKGLDEGRWSIDADWRNRLEDERKWNVSMKAEIGKLRRELRLKTSVTDSAAEVLAQNGDALRDVIQKKSHEAETFMAQLEVTKFQLRVAKAEIKALKTQLVLEEKATQTENEPPVLKEQAIQTENEPPVLKEQAIQTDNEPPVSKEQAIQTENEPRALKEQAIQTENEPPVLVEKTIQTENQPCMHCGTKTKTIDIKLESIEEQHVKDERIRQETIQEGHSQKEPIKDENSEESEIQKDPIKRKARKCPVDQLKTAEVKEDRPGPIVEPLENKLSRDQDMRHTVEMDKHKNVHGELMNPVVMGRELQAEQESANLASSPSNQQDLDLLHQKEARVQQQSRSEPATFAHGGTVVPVEGNNSTPPAVMQKPGAAASMAKSEPEAVATATNPSGAGASLHAAASVSAAAAPTPVAPQKRSGLWVSQWAPGGARDIDEARQATAANIVPLASTIVTQPAACIISAPITTPQATPVREAAQAASPLATTKPSKAGDKQGMSRWAPAHARKAAKDQRRSRK